MRSKLLISTAALLAGVAMASAQSMQGEQRGGAAQGPQSQSSPKQSPSQDGMQGTQQDRSQRGQGGQATGQAQPESGAQQGKQGQSQQRSQGQKQREQTSGQGSQRQQGQTGQSQQDQTQPSQTQPSRTQPSQTQPGQTQPSQTQSGQTQAPQQGQTTQQGQAGQAGGSANLTTEQRTRVRQTVLTGSNVPRVNNVNFALSVGTTVPTRVRVVAVPPPLIEIYPQWRGHMYFVVGDQIIIVDRNHRIVAVISV
jgi:Protein of unknown function (DUF1236)